MMYFLRTQSIVGFFRMWVSSLDDLDLVSSMFERNLKRRREQMLTCVNNWVLC
ncbi:hypothetical protein HU200_023398 [Digitaria exilis]|uniref:Uncharacterized protein n=1 Tax=Digitaria exilis TaxID=1010633 RepID=A0A835C4Q9_9POAL|nr:hypothetical protein HU200_023398 [Digitaria exilis]